MVVKEIYSAKDILYKINQGYTDFTGKVRELMGDECECLHFDSSSEKGLVVLKCKSLLWLLFNSTNPTKKNKLLVSGSNLPEAEIDKICIPIVSFLKKTEADPLDLNFPITPYSLWD